jgi:hypothetical protein
MASLEHVEERSGDLGVAIGSVLYCYDQIEDARCGELRVRRAWS